MAASPRVLTIEQGGGCLVTAGQGAMAAGVLALVAVLRNLLLGNLGEASWLVALAFLALLALVGGMVLAFGQAGITVHADDNLVERWWRLFGLVRSRSVPLDDFRAVALVREKVRGLPGGPGFLFHVRLTGDGVSLELKSAGHYEDARVQAQAVADLLGWDVVAADPGAQSNQYH